MICTLDGLCEKHDAESWSFPYLPPGEPLTENGLLVRMVNGQLVADDVAHMPPAAAAYDAARGEEDSAYAAAFIRDCDSATSFA